MNITTAPRKPQRHINILGNIARAARVALDFASNNVVLVIAWTLAIASCFIVKPDAKYIGYFDLKTLSCLFCTLAVI